VLAGDSGIIDHAQANRTVNPGGSHWDVGCSYPWDELMQKVGGSNPAAAMADVAKNPHCS